MHQRVRLPYYFSYNVPSTHVGATQAGSNNAAGGFASVAPGAHTLEMHAEGKVVGRFGIGVRAGAMTVALAVPAAAQ
ncbi:MAG TPA: hypothetical protein VF765_12605 [Polyangiaceae bacterium]